MYKKILLPLDGSEFAECSIPHVEATAIAQKVPEVVLLRVVEPMSAIAAAGYAELGGDLLAGVHKKNKDAAQDYLKRIAARFASKGITAQPVLLEGQPADEILRYAEKNGVDLIVMATHGKTGTARWLFGSVAERVARHSKVPVQLIPPAGCREAQ